MGKRHAVREEATGKPNSERLLGEFLRTSLMGAIDELRNQAWAIGHDDALEDAFERVKQLRRLRRALQDVVNLQNVKDDEPVYLVSSSLLHEAYGLLTKTRDESLIYATGAEDSGHLFALTKLVTFDLESASSAHASPEPKSQLKALGKLEKDGERLLATIHSHPGRGEKAATPSTVDLSTQAELERLGYPTIGVVVSRSGHIRFYTKERPFRVAVSGAGIERLDEKLFRLSEGKRFVSLGRRSP